VLITVDGEECATPCTIDKPSGTELRISVPASIAVSSVERLEFAGWSDGAERVRTIRLGGTDMVNLTARYRPAFLLRLLADPADAADLTCQPALQENFYPADSLVTLHAEPKPGYRFRRWDGDITGSSQIATVPMSGARIVRALFDRVPYIAPAGVRNAAGETPEMSVAPGSVISIFGASLAPEYLAGPMAPLAQTLAGVTVRLGERFLPLFFVSPDQINAQLPSDMGEGEYKIAVRWSGNPEITAFVNVNRNAPGLFTRTDGDVQVAAAALEDGSAVSASNPASEGSIVTLYGTGIGPYVNSVPDGFPTPSEVSYPHADTVELLDGDNPVEVVWSGAAAGLVGTTATRFKITQVMAANGVVRLRVRINGKVSNEVSVPLR
jgi:uncharacterized protein (TIGR03437 family)